MSFSSDYILQAAFIDDEDILAEINHGGYAGRAVHGDDRVVDLAIGDVEEGEEIS